MNKNIIKQKLIGIALIAIGIISTIATKNGTPALLIVPMGIHLIITKKDWENE